MTCRCSLCGAQVSVDIIVPIDLGLILCPDCYSAMEDDL